MIFLDLIGVLLIVVGAIVGWQLVTPHISLLGPPAALAGAVVLRRIGFWVVERIWPSARRRPRADGCVTLAVTLAALSWGGWLFKSAHSWRVELSEHDECVVRFYEWRSGNCLLEFYHDGTRLGGTTLDRGLLSHPWAVFPGPDGQSVICFSSLDLTFAAFSVDLRSRPVPGASGDGVAVPRDLDEAVIRSDFPVRACTPAEVAFVADLIAQASPSRWASHLSVDALPPEAERDRCLSFLRLATTPNLWRDPSLHGAPPHILPAELP